MNNNQEQYKYKCDSCSKEINIYEARIHAFTNQPTTEALIRLLCYICYALVTKGDSTNFPPEVKIDKSPTAEKYERDWEEFRPKTDEEKKEKLVKELEELRKK